MSLHSQVLEDRLLEIWRNVLEDSMVGRNSDFFELGGHSLLAVKLVAQIEQTIGIALPVTALFDTPTVRQLTARLLDRPDRFAAFLMEATDLAADRPPLFCLRGLFYYRELAKVLKETAPVYAVLLDGEGPSEGKIARRPGNHLLRRLAERYVSQIRRVCPTGPYYLAGLSAGGIVALEVARQLKASGQEIGLVALLDTNGPRSPLRMRMGHAPRSLLRRLLRRSGPGRAGSQDIRDLYDDAHRLFRKHRYEGNVVIFRATFSDFGYRARDLGWHRFVEGDIIVHDVPGDHLGMMREPHVSVLGSLIAPYLGA